MRIDGQQFWTEKSLSPSWDSNPACPVSATATSKKFTKLVIRRLHSTNIWSFIEPVPGVSSDSVWHLVRLSIWFLPWRVKNEIIQSLLQTPTEYWWTFFCALLAELKHVTFQLHESYRSYIEHVFFRVLVASYHNLKEHILWQSSDKLKFCCFSCVRVLAPEH